MTSQSLVNTLHIDYGHFTHCVVNSTIPYQKSNILSTYKLVSNFNVNFSYILYKWPQKNFPIYKNWLWMKKMEIHFGHFFFNLNRFTNGLCSAS